MSYADALVRLGQLGRFGVRLGLERMEGILSRLGHPHRQFPSIHLAGTNGKGSTAAMLEACLRVAGFRTGLYTSPHLCRFTERIRVNGQEISTEATERLINCVLDLEPELTFFEAVTTAAFKYFAEERVDFAVVETGMGGRLDATNVLKPEVSVLTRLDFDHQEILGQDLVAIAREKAGIIKPGVPVISTNTTPEVEALLRQCSADLGAPFFIAGQDFQLHVAPSSPSSLSLNFQGVCGSLNDLKIALVGQHQQENAALCLAALQVLREKGFSCTEENTRSGLSSVKWPGRLEWIGNYLLDGAHNSSGAGTLARFLSSLSPTQFCLIMGILGPKDPHALITPLLPYCGKVIFTRPQSPRALTPEDLARQVTGAEVEERLSSALEKVRDDPRPKLITGSLYLVGEARALLLREDIDPVQIADPLGNVKRN